MAKAREVADQIEEAVDLLDDSLQIVERTGERWLEAEQHRHKGQLLLRQGHIDAAEARRVGRPGSGGGRRGPDRSRFRPLACSGADRDCGARRGRIR